MVEEIQHQLRGIVPDLVVLSVGGGGLMNGVLEGLHRVGWGEIPVLALETDGADSLAACVRSGKWVELDDITRWEAMASSFPFPLSLLPHSIPPSSPSLPSLLFLLSSSLLNVQVYTLISIVLQSVWVQNV